MGSKGETRGRRYYIKAETVRAEILSLLASSPAMTPREIAERLDLTCATVRRELTALYHKVSVSRIGPLGSCKYTIGEQGELPL